MTPITDDTKWRCAGCGAESIATERTCDCPTNCLYKPGGFGTLKNENNPSLIARIEAVEARAKALEEAAKVADNRITGGDNEYLSGWRRAAQIIGDKIRKGVNP